MIELPEAATLARQLNETVLHQQIASAKAAHSPHKFTFYSGDPGEYGEMLQGKTIDGATYYGGMVEITAGDTVLLLNDGANLRRHLPYEKRPVKHQLLIEFAGGDALSVVVAMYAGISCFRRGTFDNRYYQVAREKPSPLTKAFDENYFETLLKLPDIGKLSAKAFLATEQRIPGLGNGVLQDILWQAQIHPKRKMGTLSDAELDVLYHTIKSLMAKMTECGGRNTEKDLIGNNGDYMTVMSKNNVGMPCPRCGGLIKKETYLGGSIYSCPGCQAI